MRIVAGVHRGRKLLAPHDASTTRPIIDRVKQSLFDRLWAAGLLPQDPFEAYDQQEADHKGGQAPGAGVLDLFCGTGSLGLEALSRGAAKCTFIDQDRNAIALLNQNLLALGMQDRAAVLCMNVLSPAWLNMLSAEPIRIAFFDPPYALLDDQPKCVQLTTMMAQIKPRIAPDGLMVLRTSQHAQPPQPTGWLSPDSHRYGSMMLHFFTPQSHDQS